MYEERLRENLPRVRGAIEEAAREAGRDPGDVRLVAVTKGHPLEAVRAALAAGLSDLGENRVSELEMKAAAVDPGTVRWHMIGHLQRRKAPRVVGLTELIHSVDSVRLAERLDRVAEEARVGPVRVLAQANTSGEDAKYGLEGEGALDAVLRIAELPRLRLEGLMTMAPLTDQEPVLAATFAGLRRLLEDARARSDRVGPELSMGMTNDLKVAVREGSTLVRIGTALFGARENA